MSQATDAAPPTAGRSILGRLWAGEVPLAQAFWSWAMLGGTALNVAATLLAMAVLAMGGSGLLAALLFGLAIPYNFLMLIAVWRSAEAYPGPRLWADLARIAILVWAIVASAT